MTRFFPEFHNWLETVRESSVLLRLAKSFTETPNQNMRSASLTFAVNNKVRHFRKIVTKTNRGTCTVESVSKLIMQFKTISVC